MIKVACSEFVKRQTEDSGFSHFAGDWSYLEQIVKSLLSKSQFVRPGYKDGVILVDIPKGYTYSAGYEYLFYCPIITINEKTKLNASWAPRLKGEAPFIRIATKAKKQPAKYTTIVLYRHDILEEDNARSSNAEWEIIAIKSRLSKEEDPMDPYTMCRNFLHLDGGTKADFTAQQFAESILFWNNHVMCLGKKPNIFIRLFRKICYHLIWWI